MFIPASDRRTLGIVSKGYEDRARRKFADHMRETSARAKADAAELEARKKVAGKKTSREDPTRKAARTVKDAAEKL